VGKRLSSVTDWKEVSAGPGPVEVPVSKTQLGRPQGRPQPAEAAGKGRQQPGAGPGPGGPQRSRAAPHEAASCADQTREVVSRLCSSAGRLGLGLHLKSDHDSLSAHCEENLAGGAARVLGLAAGMTGLWLRAKPTQSVGHVQHTRERDVTAEQQQLPPRALLRRQVGSLKPVPYEWWAETVARVS
jgi:hypothetical protein